MIDANSAVRLVSEALREHPDVEDPGPLQAEADAEGFRVRGQGADLHVDLRTGSLTGTATVDPLAARARTLTLMGFAVMSAWFASGLFVVALMLIELPLRVLGRLQLVAPPLALGIGVVGAVFLAVRYSRWVGSLEPRMLDEPVATVAEGLARWPSPGGLDRLLGRASLLLFVGSVAWALASLLALLEGKVLVGLLQLAVVGVALGAAVVSRRMVSPAPERAVELKAGGDWGELVGIGLEGSRFALIVVLIAMGVKLLGAESAATEFTKLPWSELVDTVLQAVVIFAVVRAKPTPARRAAALSLLFGLIGERVAGQPGKLVATTVVLFITLRSAYHHPLPQAVRLTMEFELWLAIGRILGRVFAVVFLDLYAVPLGEALGEQLAAVSAAARLEPVKAELKHAQPLSDRTVQLTAVIGLVIAGVVFLHPWGTFGATPPSSWAVVQGDGWTIRTPGAATMQSVPRVSLGGARHTSLRTVVNGWKGSLFVVQEFASAADSDLTPDGFLTAAGYLTSGGGTSGGHVQGCGGVLLGVLGDDYVRCLSSRLGSRVVLACVHTPGEGTSMSEGELAFLSSLTVEGTAVAPTRAGLESAECRIGRSSLREAQRLLNR